MSFSDWEASLERARETKNAFFAQYWQSPIPPQERPRFKGLKYYPPELSYRFELELHEHPEKGMVRMAYTKGNEQDFIRWGEFRFKIAERELSLQAYKRSREEKMLFVPVKDATSGRETYGAGRYLDLEPDRDHLWSPIFSGQL
jgi:uncharacterized protein (DUF1684 family)